MKKVQKIKLTPLIPVTSKVKLDASIIAMDENGAWFDLEFDGPRPNIRLYPYGSKGEILCNRERAKSLLADGATPVVAFEIV